MGEIGEIKSSGAQGAIKPTTRPLVGLEPAARLKAEHTQPPLVGNAAGRKSNGAQEAVKPTARPLAGLETAAHLTADTAQPPWVENAAGRELGDFKMGEKKRAILA